MDLLSDSLPTIPLYSILLVESHMQDGTESHTEHKAGIFAQSIIFNELQELYMEYGVQGGFVFNKESIANRMGTMSRVLCWFGFRGGRRYTCYIERT